MNFNNFENSRPPEKEPGTQLTKIEDKISYHFSIDKMIDGLDYRFTMHTSKNKKGKTNGGWELIFEVDNTMTLTNKGFGAIKQVGESIAELINLVSKKDTVKTVVLHGSSETISHKDFVQLSTALKDIELKNPEKFNGFHFENETPYGFTQTISIQNNIVSTSYLSDLEEWTLHDFLSDGYHVSNILNQPDLTQELCNYLGIKDFKPALASSSDRNKSIQRAKLFERILKQHFPLNKVTLEDSSVVVAFD